MNDKDAQLRGRLEDLFSDLGESSQAEASPVVPLKSTPERATKADRHPTGQPQAALRILAENATDAILLSDLAGRVIFSNRACCDLLGYGYVQKEMVGLETAALWPDEEREWLTGETQSVQQALAGEWHGQAMQRRKDGSLLRVSLTLLLVRDEQEQPIAVASIIRDLTEHKQAEEVMADQAANGIESARLFEEARARADVLRVLNAGSQKLVSVLDVDQVLVILLDEVPHLFPGVSSSVWLTDSANGELVCRHAVGIQSEALRGQRVAPGEGLSGWVVAHGESVIVPDAMADERHFAGVDRRSGLTVRSFLSVPLKVKEDVIGVLNAADATVNRFGATDQTLLELLAASGAIAISNALLFEQTSAAHQRAEAHVHEMQILQRVIRAASSTFDLGHVLDALFDALSREMGFTFIQFNQIDEPANQVRTVRAVGLAQGMNGVVRRLDQLQDDILMDVARKGQIEIIDGWDDRFDRVVFEREGHAAMVRAFVPLLLQEKPFGILEAGYLRQERAVITADEVRLLGSLADQLAVTIQNALLFQDAQRRADRELTTSEIMARMRETLDMDTVLQTAVREIGDAMGITEVEVRLASTAPSRQ